MKIPHEKWAGLMKSGRGLAKVGGAYAKNILRLRRWSDESIKVERTFSIFSGAKDTDTRSSWVRQGRMGTDREGLGTQDLEANTELRHSAFS